MPSKGWDVHVYRTDIDPEKNMGFFFDEAQANTWVKKQKEGSYEVSTEKPSERRGHLDAGQEAEEARSD